MLIILHASKRRLPTITMKEGVRGEKGERERERERERVERNIKKLARYCGLVLM